MILASPTQRTHHESFGFVTRIVVDEFLQNTVGNHFSWRDEHCVYTELNTFFDCL